jgi:trans-aconitate methyltransferase
VDLTQRTATSDDYFEEFWSLGDDPWDHGSRWYETRKYDLTAAALPRMRYRRSFEPGCGSGFLTQRLGVRSEEHVAMERHPRGVAATARRCASLPTVAVVEGTIPSDWPPGRFDLVVLSEVLYYLDASDLDVALERVEGSLVSGGDLLIVHYRPPVAEHAWTGDEVHARVRSQLGWDVVLQIDDPQFRLEVLHR